MARLASEVGAHLTEWRVKGATLAAPGALEAALTRLDDPLIDPFFMAKGWFTGRELPRRLAATGHLGLRQMQPFGTDPALPMLIADLATQAIPEGVDNPSLLLAAHGSKVSRSSRDTTLAVAEAVRSLPTPFARILCGFVEETPFLEEAARAAGAGVCLPFFALEAGHVTDDVPEALAATRFRGPCLPPLGQAAAVPGMIARALQAAENRDGA